MEVIDGKELDSQFKYDVAAWPGGENITLCYSCGTCTAACPASAIDPAFNPRKIIRQVLLGMRKEVLSSPELWQCLQCYACYSQCPQNVKFRDVMRALREMAVKEGFAELRMLQAVQEVDRFNLKVRHELVKRAVAGDYKKTISAIEDALNL